TQDVDMGKITIDQTVLLDSILIQAKNKLIERKVDRLVFNVENSVLSQGLNVIDVLKKTPLINVQNESISIVGKGGVVVMINEKIINIPQSDLSSYLQSLNSSDVKKIEVITTPPSKYEAQGNAGLINIVLKTSHSKGWSGNITSFYQKNRLGGFGTGAALSYKSEKIISSFKFNQRGNTYRPHGSRNLLGKSVSIYTDEVRTDKKNTFNGSYNFEYQINKKQNIGVLYDFTANNTKMNAIGISKYQHLDSIDSVFTTNQKQIWKTKMHTFNVYYDFKFDSIGRKLSLGVNYLSTIPDKVNNFTTSKNKDEKDISIRNTSLMKYAIYSGQVDMVLPNTFGTVELGAKYTLFKNNSQIDYYDHIDSNYIVNSNNSNYFSYKEQNYSTYVSYQKDISEKWSLKAGLRYEYTILNSNDNAISNDKYGEFFPTFYISYSPTSYHDFSLNYSRRIERPSFQELNPFKWYTNPYTYFSGTPSLLPVFSNNIELNYTFHNVLSSSIFYQYDINGTSNIADLVDGQYSNIIRNSYNENVVGIQLSYNDNLFDRWETSISATAYYDETKPIIKEAVGLKVYTFSYSSANTFALNDTKTSYLMLNFWHSLPYTYANITIETQMSLDMGIKFLLCKKKLSINALIEDIFKTTNSKGYSINSGYRSEFANYFDSRKLVISLNYSFGNSKVKSKDIPFDEKSRTN
ncbi:outer membrane beta-barrel family protein, partial [Myroides sp. DF42-4-2]|uniref:outer membrane beta-barrel family protein n=1 Tax=Myroides sp. DF42-4-2 TaxID=2746726 RepID=UPI002577E2A4